ncbi:DUF99 family protein [Halorubrum sp. JWXQ-INN 858]|uniref:endonuclease dU n=1 Tax=Halorubrum sp. JWXQ-INN 858 TaxID=2690782 RepID=UPI0013F97837|nr:DUF99 family protein [Halorubrum sp. JWXQ-INN 858]MWV65631.1 DUF99 family protein [Halorubrum sp. JWXQ-INN 858]
MRPGSRTLGVAFSDGDRTSRLGGAVVRLDGTVDGLVFGACTVGGTDATDAILTLAADLGRDDVRRVLVAGVAPAWFNLVDLRRLHDALDRPVLAVSYEASPGLEPALSREFDGDALATRLDVYGGLPPRRRVDDERGSRRDPERPLFVRAVGIDDDRAAALVAAHTEPGFRRPEPVRIAAIAARAHRAAVEG